MKDKRGKGERIRSESICRIEELLKRKREKMEEGAGYEIYLGKVRRHRDCQGKKEKREDQEGEER